MNSKVAYVVRANRDRFLWKATIIQISNFKAYMVIFDAWYTIFTGIQNCHGLSNLRDSLKCALTGNANMLSLSINLTLERERLKIGMKF